MRRPELGGVRIADGHVGVDIRRARARWRLWCGRNSSIRTRVVQGNNLVDIGGGDGSKRAGRLDLIDWHPGPDITNVIKPLLDRASEGNNAVRNRVALAWLGRDDDRD